jgi:hypothetical protein
LCLVPVKEEQEKVNDPAHFLTGEGNVILVLNYIIKHCAMKVCEGVEV